jgi:DNA-binding PadR family transcriptional regulator
MKSRRIPDELQKMLPLTPAVFFVLFALADGEKHGYAIMRESTSLSGGKFRMGPATLYTTLERLLDLSLIEEVSARRDETDNRRRYYRLSDCGKLLLEAEANRMESVVRLVKKKNLVPRAAE